MNIDILNNHLMILLNGPEIEDFNFEKVYEHLVNKKPRKSRSSYESESLIFYYLLYYYSFFLCNKIHQNKL